MSALLELQRSFLGSIVSGETAALDDAIIGGGFTAAQRVQIYRNNTFITLTEALATTYPAVCRLVDRRFFNFAVARYIAENLPDRPCLFEYGAGFAGFLAGFAPVADYPFLPDVARLEWAVNAAWNAPERPPLSAETLAAEATRAGEGLRLGLDALYLSSGWEVDAIWLANRGEAETGASPAYQPVRLEIRRAANGISVRRLDVATWTLRDHLARGETLGHAAEATLSQAADFDLTAALRALAFERLPVAILPNQGVNPCNA